MSTSWTILQVCKNKIDGEIAKGRLAEAGIPAVLFPMNDGAFGGMDSLFTVRVELLVQPERAEDARAVLDGREPGQ